MKPIRSLLLPVLSLTLLLSYARPCAFSINNPAFVDPADPDAPYQSYTAGRIGVVMGTYRIRHLIVAYRYLTGVPLTPQEQQAAIAVDKHYVAPEENSAWDTGRKVPGQDYQYFNNCLTDAKTTAAETLAQRQKSYGASNPEVINWQQAQDAVFSNCKAAGTIPDPAPANASLWLKQDRAYQIAAAHFYALDYDKALSGFTAIAADRASPWHTLAPYLVARCYIRRALVPDAVVPNQHRFDDLTAAKNQLDKVLADPDLKSIHSAASHLHDYVEARRDPATQASVLANRLAHPSSSADYQQNAIDLTYIWNGSAMYPMAIKTTPPNPTRKQSAPTPLEEWLDSFKSALPDGNLTPPNPSVPLSSSISRYQTTHQPIWLIAALIQLKPGNPEAAQLIAAARAIPATSPAYPSVTYQRLRLTASSAPDATFNEISSLLPDLEKTQPRSAINLFSNLRPQTAPDLAAFLRSAPLQPANMGDFGPPSSSSPTELCGVNVAAPTTLHFTDESALILNQRMPIGILRDAALTNVLPKNLNFVVAHVAWTRALILDDPATANALAPILGTCQPAFKPWLDRYAAARTPDDRHAEALLALMRFTSADPNIPSAIERDFAAYDSFRSNWWSNQTSEAPVASASAILSPPFLTKADQTLAREQTGTINKLAPSASDYFARQVLTFVATHPNDPRNSDLLGFAMRAVRNAPRTDATKELNHQLFDTTHKKYPNSEWAKRYTTWE